MRQPFPLHVNLRFLTVALALCAAGPAAACDYPGLEAEADLALHATTPGGIEAGRDAARAPVLAPGVLWEVRLHPRAQVAFARVPFPWVPGRGVEPSNHAGLLRFQVPTRGRWRIALSHDAWVDLVDGGVLLPGVRHGSDGSCPQMPMMIDFQLPLEHEVLIQLGGVRPETLRLSLRRVH